MKASSDDNKKEFYDEVSVYNYDFRHEFAVYKEYEHAMNDGKLDEYHNWLINRHCCSHTIPDGQHRILALFTNI